MADPVQAAQEEVFASLVERKEWRLHHPDLRSFADKEVSFILNSLGVSQKTGFRFIILLDTGNY